MRWTSRRRSPRRRGRRRTCLPPCRFRKHRCRDRKSTRLNSSHSQISYAVFCLKKKTVRPWVNPHVAALLLMSAVVFLCYARPLFSPSASIQWDAVDVHYSSQNYFSESIRAGKLPYWTPYIYSGFPFLADPQVGAWYPLHWPFFLAGITPNAIEWELFLHAFFFNDTATTEIYTLSLHDALPI